MILTLALLTAAAASDAATSASPAYFPSDYTQPRIICDAMRPDRREPALAGNQVAYYTRHLAAAQEPSLAPLGKSAPGAAQETIRFTWLRSGQPAITVRIETRGKASHVIARQLSGRSGQAPGGIARTAERDLTPAEATQLKALIKASELDSLPPKQCHDEITLDGARWLFERAGSRGDYRLVDRFSPGGGPLRALGLFMVGLTGWEQGAVY